MKTFMVVGTIVDPQKMTDEIMKQHKKYTTKWMKSNHIVLTGLPNDYSGVFSLVKADELASVQEFYANEPFFLNGIQTYEIKEVNLHYLNKEAL